MLIKTSCYFSPPFVFQEKEEHRPRSSSTASGSGRGGGGRGEYGRHYFERGRERGGGRPENPPPPRHQDDWRCPEVNQQRLYYFVRFYVHLSSCTNGILRILQNVCLSLWKDTTDARISVEKNGDVSSLG